MSIKATLIVKDKFAGEPRAFGDANSLMKKLVILLAKEGNLPEDYTEVENLEECDFAPGSICLDTDGNTAYIYDGEEWKEWG